MQIGSVETSGLLKGLVSSLKKMLQRFGVENTGKAYSEQE